MGEVIDLTIEDSDEDPDDSFLAALSYNPSAGKDSHVSTHKSKEKLHTVVPVPPNIEQLVVSKKRDDQKISIKRPPSPSQVLLPPTTSAVVAEEESTAPVAPLFSPSKEEEKDDDDEEEVNLLSMYFRGHMLSLSSLPFPISEEAKENLLHFCHKPSPTEQDLFQRPTSLTHTAVIGLMQEISDNVRYRPNIHGENTDCKPSAFDDSDEDNDDENDDVCYCCNEVGMLILCDACPKSFHLLCLDPQDFSKEDLEDGLPFTCPECTNENMLDDSELKVEDVTFVRDTFSSVKKALVRSNLIKSLETKPQATTTPTTTGMETTTAKVEPGVAQSMMNLFREEDTHFLAVTKELEGKFQSKSIAEAEKELTDHYVELQRDTDHQPKKVRLSTNREKSPAPEETPPV